MNAEMMSNEVDVDLISDGTKYSLVVYMYMYMYTCTCMYTQCTLCIMYMYMYIHVHVLYACMGLTWPMEVDKLSLWK